MKIKLRIILLLFLLTSLSYLSSAQCDQPNAQFEFPNGVTRFCEGAVVTIDNRSDEENPTGCVEFMILDWGDSTIDTFTDFANKTHRYDISDSLACSREIPVNIIIGMTLYYPGGVSNFSSKSLSIYPSPVASFSAESPICTNSDPVCFDNNSCWDSTWTWTITPPSGSPIVNYDIEEPCHEFSEVGMYQIELVASNECPVDLSVQSDNAIQTLQVIQEANAVAQAVDGVVDPDADTLVVCLGGGGKVSLDGSLSEFETSYLWDTRISSSNYDWVVDPPSQRDPTIANPMIQFLRPGLFSIVLTVNNACGRPKRDTLLFDVVDADVLILEEVLDECDQLVYSPGNISSLGDAEYTINGTLIANADFPVTLDTGIYIIEGRLENICGIQTKVDTVIVSPPETVSILSPTDTTICVGSDSILISYTNPGGTWQGDHLIIRGDTVYFDPTDSGRFELTYSKGVGDCEDTESIFVNVAGVNIQASDYTICSTSGPFQLSASPPGGSWSSPDCPLCIRADSFLVSELLALGLTSVEVNYAVTSASACQGEGTITVSIDDPIASFIVDSVFCASDPVSVDFPDASGDLTWLVDGVDAGPPPFVNLSGGAHTIELVAEAGNCDDRQTQDIYITTPPANVGFTVDVNEGCADLTVTITNTTSSFDNESYQWYLGDSLISTDIQPGTIILPSGASDTIYTIRLEAGNNCAGQSATESITVFPLPNTFFGPMKDFYCSGDTVTFANVSTGGPMNSWLWDYGNGRTSTDSIPLDQIYFADTIPQTYTITLTAINDCGTSVYEYELTINPTDVRAFFNIGLAPVCVGEEICLRDLSTPNSRLLWDLGDGNTSTRDVLCHTYSSPGTYTITLKAFGCGFDSIDTEVTVLPMPEFQIENVNLGCPNEPIIFSAISVNNVDQYLWDFGDGDTSTLANPVHQYAQPGSYRISLTGTSVDGCELKDSTSITIPDVPVADFMINTDSLCTREQFLFTPTSTGNIVDCFWDFGDGTTSKECDGFAVYPEGGRYTVRLIVTNISGCSDTLDRLITVYERPAPDFDIQINRQCTPAEVTFTNTTLNGQSFEWDFGNGTTSRETNPTIIYPDAGTFTVSLLSANGVCTEAITKQVTIYETPTPIVALSASEGCPETTFTFGAAFDTQDLDYTWKINNGVTFFDSSITYQFDAPGDYELTLVVENEFCSDSLTENITIFDPVEITSSIIDNLCFDDEEGQINLSIENGTAPYQYTWSNNNNSKDQVNLSNGTYQLTITDQNSCSLSDSFTITSPPQIEALVSDSAIATCAGDSDAYICLSVTGGVGDYQYLWSNGRSADCLENISAGRYPVTITDENNCAINLVFEAYENPPLVLFDSIENVSCYGFEDGRIFLDSIGGGVTDFYNAELTGPDTIVNGRNFSNLKPGNYQLLIQDLEGCTLEKNYVIGEPDSLFVDIVEDTILLPLGETITIDTRNNAQNPILSWSPTDSLSCTNCAFPDVNATRTRWYHLALEDEGCEARDSVLILISLDKEFYVPNTFTPNGDGRNDIFRIRTRLESIRQIVTFQIFDRWGEKVFQADNFRPQDENPIHAWDGYFRNNLLAPDTYTYFFEIRYADQDAEIVKGTVILMR